MFTREDGQADCFQYKSDGGRTLWRIKQAGLLSHVDAQKKKLGDFVSGRLEHGIVVRIADDANLWVSPEPRKKTEGDAKLNAAFFPLADGVPDPHNTVGKLGKKKVCPVLGMIQRFLVRRTGQCRPESISIHAPAQVLPKAAQQLIVSSFHNGCKLRM